MFKSMIRLDEPLRTTVLSSFKPKPMDVDKMEICMTPDRYLQEFDTPLALVRLSSHAPRIRRTKPGDRGHEFSNWLLLAESCHQLWIDPIYKGAFYQELKKLRTIHPAASAWVSTYGNAHLPIRTFVGCLKRSGCKLLRYKAYGQKMPISMALVHESDPAQRMHPKSHLNEWDIGVTFESPYIILFKPTLGNTRDTTCYTMLAPASRDFGSIQTSIHWNHTSYKVKIYPRLVHVIKSFNSRLQGEILTTLAGVKKRVKASVNMIQTLSQVPEPELGGFRIEVSVQAPTLTIAQQWVANTPLLDFGFWTNPSVDTGTPRLNTMMTTKEALLLNANWMVQRSTTLKIFQGTAAHPPTKIQKQGVADVLSSFGWNAGRLKITKPDDKAAWWRGTTDEMEQSDPEIVHPDDALIGSHRLKKVHTKGSDTTIGLVLAYLNKTYVGNSGIKSLVNIIRCSHPKGYIPCQLNPTHQYDISGWQPFRMRCRVHKCRHNMNYGNSYTWFADLIATGQVDRHLVGLPPAGGKVAPAPTPKSVNPRPSSVPRSCPAITAPSTTREIHRSTQAKSQQFRKTLQGPSPPYPYPMETTTQHSEVDLVDDSIPPAYHTSRTAKDGNCMFEAIAAALGSSYSPTRVRKDAVRWMADHSENFIQFIEVGQTSQQSAYRNYLQRMKESGEWGDDLVLNALCQSYKLRISVLKKRRDGTLIWAHLGDNRHTKCLWLYLSDNHYENLYCYDQLQEG